MFLKQFCFLNISKSNKNDILMTKKKLEKLKKVLIILSNLGNFLKFSHFVYLNNLLLLYVIYKKSLKLANI